jgi:hypothetical protein
MMQHSSIRKLTAAGLAGALTLAVATPSVAGGGRTAAAVAGGFAAGALIGAAAASANAAYYGPGYAYEPGYVYDPGYAEYPAPSTPTPMRVAMCRSARPDRARRSIAASSRRTARWV